MERALLAVRRGFRTKNIQFQEIYMTLVLGLVSHPQSLITVGHAAS